MPKVSVVMPVLNGEKHLHEAIESILKQSFNDFEFIIINDGSTDKTEEIINSYTDPRIVYINNGVNLGLSKSFNIGIRASLGEYIARMDADDIALPHRLEKQLKFLELNKADIVGSSAILISENGEKIGKHKRPLTHIELKWQSLSSTPLIHPTVMARASLLKENLYDESLYNSEDYELWSRLLFSTQARFANIAEPLMLYRIGPASFTGNLGAERRIASAENSLNNISRYVEPTMLERLASLKMRGGDELSFKEGWSIFRLYSRAARAFMNRENLTFIKAFGIYLRLLPTALSLIKHSLRHS